MSKTLFVFTDGGARGNPGPAAVGFIIKDDRGETLAKVGKFIGRATNNIAEYTAVVEALKRVTKLPSSKVSKISFFLDSKLVVNQLRGLYKIKNSNLRNLILEVRKLEQEIKADIFYYLLTREKNKQADLLVQKILNKNNP